VEARISIRRRRDDLYLKLEGNFNRRDPVEILGAVRRLVGVSLQWSPSNAQVFFTFQIHAKIEGPQGNPRAGS
jgi:hypothetical protein